MERNLAENQMVWWQDEADVWEGKEPGDRKRWIGRFNLKEIGEAIEEGKLRF